MGWEDTYEVNFNYDKTYTKLHRWSARPYPSIIKFTKTDKGLIQFWLILKNDVVKVQGGTKGKVNIFYNKETSPSEAIAKLRKYFVDDEGRTCDWNPKKLAQEKLFVLPRELLSQWVEVKNVIDELLKQLPNVYPSVDTSLFGVFTATAAPVPFRKWVKLGVEEDLLFKSLGSYPWFRPILRMSGQFRRESEEFWVMYRQVNSKIRKWVECEVFERIPPKKWKKFQKDWLGEFTESFFRLAILRVEGGKENFSKRLKRAKTFYRESGPLLPLTWMGTLIQPWSRRGLPPGWEDKLNELFIKMLEELDGSRFSADATMIHKKLKRLEGLRTKIEKELGIILAKGRSSGGWALLREGKQRAQ